MGTLQKPAVVACQRQQLGALLGGEWGGEREQSGRGAWHTTARAAWVMKMVAPDAVLLHQLLPVLPCPGWHHPAGHPVPDLQCCGTAGSVECPG